MQAVTVSSKFQVSIPKIVRQKLQIRAGQKLSVKITDEGMCLTPIPTLDDLAGAFPGLPIKGLREEVDRL